MKIPSMGRHKKHLPFPHKFPKKKQSTISTKFSSSLLYLFIEHVSGVAAVLGRFDPTCMMAFLYMHKWWEPLSIYPYQPTYSSTRL